MAAPEAASLRRILAIFGIARLVINSGYRMVYPFLPVIARGLGVSFELLALAVTGRALMGMTAPLLGLFADRHGRKVSMMSGSALFALAMLLAIMWRSYAGFVLVLMLGALAKSLFDPAMQAYIGDRVPYQRRGLAIAVTELSWSASFLLGMPLVGWLISRSGWLAPFPWLAAAGVAVMLLIWRRLPPDRPSRSAASAKPLAFRAVLSQPQVLAGLSVSLLIGLGNEAVGIIYGAWMEQSFALQAAALGAASAAIGLAELGGEGLVAVLVDRLGKRRSLALGIGLNAAMCLLIPITGQTLTGALLSLFFFYLTFEFSIVSAIPLITELAPLARATIMAGNVAAISAGRAFGAMIGPALFAIDLAATTSFSALLGLSALACLLLFVRQE